MTLQAHFSIYHHCRVAPTVQARSRDGFHWIDIAAPDSGGLLLTIHCAGSEQAERAAEKLREVFAIARSKQTTLLPPLDNALGSGSKSPNESLIEAAKERPSDYWDEVHSEQIKP